MSAWTRRPDGKAAQRLFRLVLESIWKGLGANSEEKHEPVSDIDTVAVDSLKALDPKRPIREHIARSYNVDATTIGRPSPRGLYAG